MNPDEFLRRAREELPAVRLLLDEDYPAQAMSRAYYAAFYAASAALAALGESRARHAGVISAFGKLVVQEGGLDPAAGRCLRRLFELRAAADYDFDPVEADAAEQAADDAELVVDAVDGWLAKRPAE